jgi:hypothetical protein
VVLNTPEQVAEKIDHLHYRHRRAVPAEHGVVVVVGRGLTYHVTDAERIKAGVESTFVLHLHVATRKVAHVPLPEPHHL